MAAESESVKLGLAVAKGVYDLAKKQGLTDKLLNAFKKKQKILVLGSTGVGKDQLVGSLTDPLAEAISKMNRTAFNSKLSIDVLKQPFIFINTPDVIPEYFNRGSTLKLVLF